MGGYTSLVDDKIEQLALVYVTFNSQIVDVLFCLQPEGGFFPLVLMQSWCKLTNIDKLLMHEHFFLFVLIIATKVKLDFEVKINEDDKSKLTKLFNAKFKPAMDIYNADNDQSSNQSYLFV